MAPDSTLFMRDFIQKCPLSFPFKSGLQRFGIQSLNKVFFFFFRPHFPDLNSLCLA